MKPPLVRKEDGNARISFEVSRLTDVEVAVLDSSDKVIRHLAAGVLGPNAPAPLKKSSLAQEVVWDGRDDLGNPAKGGSFTVRVRLGSRAKLIKYLGHKPLCFAGKLETIVVGPKGELYVLVSETAKFGKVEFLVLDKNGRYLRTIVPYPASTPWERTASVGHLLIENARVPILFSGHAFTVYPLVCGLRAQTMAWHPRGYLVAASSPGTAREHGVPRYLLAFHPEGGGPEEVPFVGPKILEPRDFLGGGGERAAAGLDRLAVSPDGEYVYFVQHVASPHFRRRCWKHGVYRVKWNETKVESLWIGKEDPGAGDDELDDPQGIAVARDGTLFICDRNNDRVKVYSPDGRLLGKFPVVSPEQIAIHYPSGCIFVLSVPNWKAGEYSGNQVVNGKLLAFSPWQNGATRPMADFTLPGLRTMALDSTSEPPLLWTVIRTQGDQKLMQVTFRSDRFEPGLVVSPSQALMNPSFIAADPTRGRVIVKEHLAPARSRPFRTIDIEKDEMSTLDVPGADITLDSHGNMYVMDGYGRNTLSRYDPAGSPLPFPKTGTHQIQIEYRSYGPDMGLRGHRVGLNGDIYVIRSVNHGVGASLDVYATDGTLKRAGLVAGLGGADSGLGVDAAGNLYVGVNIRSPDNPFPPEFVGQVPKESWVWWKLGRERNKQPAPWTYIYCNPYLWHMGAILKFGPEGGIIYGQQGSKRESAVLVSPGTDLENAPSDAIPFKTACYKFDVKLAGATWRYGGVSGIPASLDGPRPDPGCSCMPSHFDTDLYGRTYAPNAFLFVVDMLDSAGNRIARIGRYGTRDDSDAEVVFAGPVACDFAEADERLYVSDIVNRRVAVIAFKWVVTARVPVR